MYHVGQELSIREAAGIKHVPEEWQNKLADETYREQEWTQMSREERKSARRKAVKRPRTACSKCGALCEPYGRDKGRNCIALWDAHQVQSTPEKQNAGGSD